MHLNFVTKVVLAFLLILSTVALGCRLQFYTEAISSPFFAFTLISVLVIHFRIRPSLPDAILVLLGAFLFAVIDFQLLHYRPVLTSWFSFAGLSSVLILGIRAVWAENASRKMLLLAFVPSLLFVVSEYFAGTFLGWTAAVHPKVYDLYLYSFDGSLRVQLPFLVGKGFALWPALRLMSLFFYVALPIPIAFVYAGQLLRTSEKAIPSFIAFLATGPVGIAFYNLLPALGPAHLFLRDFPWHPLPINQVTRLLVEPVAIPGPPNAIPSLHMAWTLLVWWYSRGLSWWERTIALAFLAFTVLATLGTGEHYFVDLVVAFPFSVLMEALCSFSLPVKDGKRLASIVFGLLTTLGWLVALRHLTRFFWLTPVLPWTLCLGTILFSLLLEDRLQRTTERAKSEAPLELPIPVSAPNR